MTDGVLTRFYIGVMSDDHADGVVASDPQTSRMGFAGVLLQRSQGGGISGVTADATGGAQGLVISGRRGAEIAHSVVSGANDAGIYVFSGDGKTVDRNESSSNSAAGESAVRVHSGRASSLTGSASSGRIRSEGTGAECRL